jgi:hypothetical protein
VVHKFDQQGIGHCGLKYWPDSSDVEVLYALDKRYWGRGLATEGARASRRYGFAELQLDRTLAAALVDNHASRRVLEKLGMQYESNRLFRSLEKESVWPLHLLCSVRPSVISWTLTTRFCNLAWVALPDLTLPLQYPTLAAWA